MKLTVPKALAICLLCAITTAKDGKKATVAVRKAALRDKPSYRSKVIGTLKYEETVVVLSKKKKSWVEVELSKAKGAKTSPKGWMSFRSLYTGKVGRRKGTSDTSAGAGKTTSSLAGRGFNEKVENARRRNATSSVRAGYETLDRLLGTREYNVGSARVGPFMDKGQLKGGN